MYVWAPVKKGKVAKETEKTLNGHRSAILATESEIHQDFTRRVWELQVRMKAIKKEARNRKEKK